jgi:ferredoxin
MPFGCENGECGTCLCTVVKGLENINAKNHNEWLFLQKRNATPNQRLGCQIYVKKGEVEIEY